MNEDPRKHPAGAVSRKRPRVSVRRDKTGLRRGLVMTWTALAGLAAAAAFSAVINHDGSIGQMMAGDTPDTFAIVKPEAMPANDGSPRATGSTTPLPTATDDIVDLKARIAQLQTDVRRSRIEKNALLQRIAQLSGDATDPIDNIVTGSLPAMDAARPAKAPGGTMRDALTQSLSADLTRARTHVTETQFAVEVGYGENLSQLRAQWRGLSSTHASLFDGFEPVIAVRENARGVTLHLLAGPVRNAADAVEICAQLRNIGTVCAAVPYEGQRLLSQ